MMSSADKGIKFWYKNLDWDILELLLVWVDKENLIEFSFDYSTLLIHILCLLLFMNSHVSLLVIPQFSKKKKKKINNDLVILTVSWHR